MFRLTHTKKFLWKRECRFRPKVELCHLKRRKKSPCLSMLISWQKISRNNGHKRPVVFFGNRTSLKRGDLPTPSQTVSKSVSKNCGKFFRLVNELS